MKRNMKAEYNSSMEELGFSPEQKAAMVQDLMVRMEEMNMKKQTFSSRRLVLVAAAAVMLVAMLTGAAAFTRWSKNAQNRYNPSQQIKEQAEKSGLSVMLEETKSSDNPNEVLSVTDQGVTITAVQTIVDNYRAEITFRIEGFEVPEDEYPATRPTVTIDGDAHFHGMQEGGFYDGTTWNEAGEWVYASTGEPVAFEPDGEYESAILDWVADDGSLEYTHIISFQETDGRYLGKEIVFTFDSIDFGSQKKAGMREPQVVGNWELRWILTGTSDSITVTPNAEIGDSGVVLLDAELGQLSLRTRYQLKEYWEGWNQLVDMPQAVRGVRMKDGSEQSCVPSTTGFEDQENMIYFIQSTMFDAILDISQVESLIFRDVNGETVYIPIA